MKITDIRTFVTDCYRTNWIFIKVYTDEGLCGVGEATLEYKEKALVGAVEHLKAVLTGQNPLTIEKHVHDIYRDAYWRGGAVLMSARRFISCWAEKCGNPSGSTPMVGSLGPKRRRNLLIRPKKRRPTA